MARQYDQEAVVRIWRNVKTLSKVPTSHFGHAAVTVRGDLVPGNSDYISFWPGESAGIGLSGVRKQGGSRSDSYQEDKANEMNKMTALQLEVGYRRAHAIPYPKPWDQILQEFKKQPLSAPRRGQRPFIDTNTNSVLIWEELPIWSQSAQSKTSLPGLGAANRVWGISTRRMSRWWQDFMNSKPHYQALSKQNCAGVALWAMRAGGSEAFEPLPSVTIYAEPQQVEKYAQVVALQLDRMDKWSQEIDEDFRNAVMNGRVRSEGVPNAREMQDGLWTFEAWKRHSDLGGLSLRSKTIREIDAGVQAFHKADWDTKFPERFRAIAGTFLGIVKHRQEKSDSKRSEPVLFLANQILALLRNRSAAW